MSICAHLAGGKPHVHLSYHGLDLGRFGAFRRRPISRDGSRSGCDPVTIMSVGRAVEKKGYDILLRALSLLPGDLNWRFEHIGGGEQLKRLQALADGTRHRGQGHLARGAVAERKCCSTTAAPTSSRSPAASRQMATATDCRTCWSKHRARRLACVSTNISGVPELLVDGENGLVVPPEDPQAFAHALEKAIRDPALRHRLGDAAERTRAQAIRPPHQHRPAENPLREPNGRQRNDGGQTASPRVFFYVQHLLGIGHLARASRIARALAEDGFDVTVVTGGMPVAGFPGPACAPHRPAADHCRRRRFFRACRYRRQRRSTTPSGQTRRELLADSIPAKTSPISSSSRPFPSAAARCASNFCRCSTRSRRWTPAAAGRDIASRYPAGTRQARPRPRKRRRWSRRYFDRVLVHGDPAFARLEETFPLAAEIADKVVYTGLVAAPPPAAPTERFDVIVSAGGGAVGKALDPRGASKRQSRSASRWSLGLDHRSQPAAGRFRCDRGGCARPCQRLPLPRRISRAFSRRARLSVSQAGYNTVCDILRAGCRPLLIPFTAGGETEQTVSGRAARKAGARLMC